MQDTEERFDDDGDEQSTLQIMTNEVVDDDDALEKEGEVRVDDALEKEGEVGVDDALEEAASVGVNEMPKRVPKPLSFVEVSFTPN
ncbi:hypothetical protein Bca52824_046032 [Brassica carinata]|uniref:Uncharacterized protein n=1 Tax=Brassica carinata TaxID=52824 RepID=A0A8X7RGE6_BRACI|nr:hypothetical protein Bca52824_046032 [Brassica carinata]